MEDSAIIYTDLLPEGIIIEYDNRILIGKKNEVNKKESA